MNVIRHLEIESASPDAGDRDVIESIYQGALDAAVLRGALSPQCLSSVQRVLADGTVEGGWQSPNAGIRGIAIRVLGTVATRTATAPGGPEESAYFASAVQRREQLEALFPPGVDVVAAIEAGLARFSPARPVELSSTPDGRPFGPATVRSLSDGEGIFLHHDYHYPLPVYGDLAPRLDTSTCVSFFFVLQRPLGGGRLCVYRLHRGEEGDLPTLPNGLLDQRAVDERVPHTFFDLAEGDLIVFGSGRLYHRVEPVAGERTRVTMGGFLALDQAHQRILYWS